jgi:hypothetical protein
MKTVFISPELDQKDFPIPPRNFRTPPRNACDAHRSRVAQPKVRTDRQEVLLVLRYAVRRLSVIDQRARDYFLSVGTGCG